jgi:hypothetical protein
MAPMSSQVKRRKKRPLATNVFKLVWKISLVLLNAALAIGSDERSKPRYTAGKAQELYDDGSISGAEYARCIHGDN